MAGSLHGDSSHHGVVETGINKVPQDNPDEGGGRWYFSRKEIEENSPSRQDGIDLKKETYLCKSYCTFLQDLGMRLKVPQVTIATAIIFCHRFFLRQSHARNDRRNIATVCMFLAGKVEETPRPLKDVILVSYEIIHKKDPAAVQRIKQKEVYEQQKELILTAERLVLATLGFDLNVHHPYKPLVEAIKKFKVAQNALAQVAWNFVNDGLRTSLCLQFKPHHIAAGAIFLAAKFLKVKLPSDGEKVWWQEFDVTPRQLEEVSNQMLELYEQNKGAPSQAASEAEGSAGGSQRPLSKVPGDGEENAVTTRNPQGSGLAAKGVPLKPAPSKPPADADNDVGSAKASQSRNNDHRNSETRGDVEQNNNTQHLEREQYRHQENTPEIENNTARSGYEEEEEENSAGRTTGPRDTGNAEDRHNGRISDHKEDEVCESPQEVIKKIDKNKLKAALEKRRKSRPDVPKTDPMDDDDLIESALENGFQLEESKTEKKQSWSKNSNRPEHESINHLNHQNELGDGQYHSMKGSSSSHGDLEYVEDGELGPLDESPKHRKRKPGSGSPIGNKTEGKKQRRDFITGPNNHSHVDYSEEDRSKVGKLGYSERDQKRHVQEKHG